MKKRVWDWLLYQWPGVLIFYYTLCGRADSAQMEYVLEYTKARKKVRKSRESQSPKQRFWEWLARCFPKLLVLYYTLRRRTDSKEMQRVMEEMDRKRVAKIQKRLPVPVIMKTGETVFMQEEGSEDDGDKLRWEVDNAIQLLRSADLLFQGNNILISGNGSRNLIPKLTHQIRNVCPQLDAEIQFAWLINARPKGKTKNVLPTFYMPYSFFKESGWQGKICRRLTETEIYRVEQEEHLCWAYQNISKAFPSIDDDYARLLVLEIERYYAAALSITKPKLVLAWNQFMSFHRILTFLAKENDIPVVYIESGSFYSTFILDTFGEMGESLPGRYPGWSAWLPEPDVQELAHAKKTIHYLYHSNINKKRQPRSAVLDVSRIDPSRPTILYSGQDDIDSGMWPYDAHAQKYHSPIFASSYDAMLYLSEICKRHNWNLLYKPHPILVKWGIDQQRDIPENVIYVPEFDINQIVDLSDLVVTILSTTAYVALIRKKPVVMLGYMQLRGQGCTYEAFVKGQIEQVLIKAMQEGLTQQQQESFVRHVAMMNKYYLFDEYRKQEIRYGQNTESAARFLQNAMYGNTTF